MRQFMISFKTNRRDNDKCSRERNQFCLHIEEGWKQEFAEIDDLWVWNQPAGLFNRKFLVIVCLFFLLWWRWFFVCLVNFLRQVANIKNGENAACGPGRSFQTKLFIVGIWKIRIKKEHPNTVLPSNSPIISSSLSQHCKHGNLFPVLPAVQNSCEQQPWSLLIVQENGSSLILCHYEMDDIGVYLFPWA